MNKITLLLCFFVCSVSGLFAQICQPDSTLLEDFIGISPLADSEEPCDTIVPMEIAYQGEEYEVTFTVFIPSTIEGVNNLTLDSIKVNMASATPQGIEGLPAGLTYECFPESCVFPAQEEGCLKVYGTVDAAASAGVYDLLITATVYTNFLNGDIRYPIQESLNSFETLILSQVPDLIPPCPYQILVEESTSNQDLFNQQVSVRQNTPNPFSGITHIAVEVAEAGEYQFQVFNAVGALVHDRSLYLAGKENVSFDASQLNPGMYFYSFSNKDGQVTRRMVVQ